MSIISTVVIISISLSIPLNNPTTSVKIQSQLQTCDSSDYYPTDDLWYPYKDGTWYQCNSHFVGGLTL